MKAGKPLLVSLGVLVAGALLVALAVGPMDSSTPAAPPLSPDQAAAVEVLKSAMNKLRPLHRKLGEPEPGDWLSLHQEEGQTFAQYVASGPVVPDDKRHTIYLQPLGSFSTKQLQIVKLTGEFLSLYFGLPVTLLPIASLDGVPSEARRRHPVWGMKQVLTGHLLDEVLLPALPRDAVALIGMTSSDLWPGQGWNFVFGQAYLRQRVGVWSIFRHGDPELSDRDFRLSLLRTIKTASHELGHMFSMYHCTAYHCNMCGSNSLEESDAGPLALCPECLAKVCWATGAEPAARFARLEAFTRRHGLVEEADFYKASLRRLQE